MLSMVDICDADGIPIIEATIKELSHHGAFLCLTSAKDLPETLVVRSRPGRNCYPAVLKWTSGIRIGVEFENEFRVRGSR